MKGIASLKRLMSILLPTGENQGEINFHGNFKSWSEATSECEGYSAPLILERVRESALKIKQGEAKYERDSVIFPEIHYSQPLLIFLLYVASRSGNKLDLIDFGGALGSTYYQNRKYLDHLIEFQWKIIEQDHFVSTGLQEFQDDRLSFFYNIEDALAASKSNTLLLSSVIPYLPDPYSFLKEIRNHHFDFIIFDRTPLFRGNQSDRLTVETVPESIYKAKYPAWFLNREQFLEAMNPDFELFQEFDSWESWNVDGILCQSEAFLFLRR